MKSNPRTMYKIVAVLLAVTVAFAGLTTDAVAQDSPTSEPDVVLACGESDTADEQLGCSATRSFLLGGLLLAKLAVGAVVTGAVVKAVSNSHKDQPAPAPTPTAVPTPAPTPTPAGSGPSVPFPTATPTGSGGVAPVPTAVVVEPPAPAAGDAIGDRADLNGQADARLRRFLMFFESISGFLTPNVETPADAADTISEAPAGEAERAGR